MADRTITLEEQDWQILRAAAYELPIKVGLATLQRLELALAKPTPADNTVNPAIPRLVMEADHAS